MFDLWQRIAARPPAQVCGWRHGEPVSNAQFLARVVAWRALLAANQGRQFALYLADSVEFGAALLGAWQAGKTIWLAADNLPATCAALAGSVDGFLGEFDASCAPLTAAPSVALSDAPAAPQAPLSGEFAALVVHTSGSTGAPQAIAKKLSQLLGEVATLEALFGAALGEAAIVATVSHQHIYGLLFKVLWPLAAARPIHTHSQSFPEALAQQLALGPCLLVASPAHLKRLPEQLAWAGAKAQLRAVFSSGGPLPLDVAHGVGELLGRTPIEVYGSSETGGVAWRQRGAQADEAWLALPGVHWRVADGALLEVRSAHLPDDAWLRLADRVQACADGRFLLAGRADRIVKIEEKRISLDAIEALLAASPLVTTARLLVCAALPGERQRLAAFVVLSGQGAALLASAGKPAVNARLRALLREAVEPVALPRRWRYLAALPQDAQGKTTHALLQGALDERPRVAQQRVLERACARVLLELLVPPELIYFDGHFAGAPVLPGVVQLDWAISNGRRYFDLPAHFRAVHALKFQRVVLPGSALTLELVFDAAKGSLHFSYLSEHGPHASGRVVFDDQTAY